MPQLQTKNQNSDESEVKQMQIKRFLCIVQKFLRSLNRWNNENVQPRTNALFSPPFENQLQFHVT